MRIVFFGSFQHYSAYILESLINDSDIDVIGVVTTPPMPVGRKQIITKTPVHILAESHSIPVFTPSSLNSENPGFQNPDLFITAGYGKILPSAWLSYPKYGALNLHFSLLPAYRGANPAEWAIMCGETKTGITLIEMSDKLDGGNIISQVEIPITTSDTRETLYEKLYRLGADKLPDMLTKYYIWKQKSQFDCQQSLAPVPQAASPTPYAALLKRDDGFIPWSAIQNLAPTIDDFPSKHLKTALLFSCRDLGFQREQIIKFLSRLPRALAGYPSLWTMVNTAKGEKRMKILSFEPYIIVQIEGQQPSHFNQIKNQLQNHVS